MRYQCTLFRLDLGTRIVILVPSASTQNTVFKSKFPKYQPSSNLLACPLDLHLLSPLGHHLSHHIFSTAGDVHKSLMPQSSTFFHRRTSSTFSRSSTKPPSVFRYTAILLKARPSVADLTTISSFSSSRSAPTSPTYRPNNATYWQSYFGEPEARAKTPPPPYTP